MPASVSVADPAGHAMQAATDTGLYSPAAHAVHVAAAGNPNVFVIEPEAHNAHAAVEFALYCPAAHTVQAMAPVQGVSHPVTYIQYPAAGQKGKKSRYHIL